MTFIDTRYTPPVKGEFAKRILQVGFGVIGREIWTDYSQALALHDYMVTDLVADIPEKDEWDGEEVDIAVIVVNTPAAKDGDGFDYSDLVTAVRDHLMTAKFVLIRSTVGLGFFETSLYRLNAHRIGFSPEFYGATKWSRRAALDMGFAIFTPNVPAWFRDETTDGVEVMLASPREVAMAKLAENAYLATKVTFFHELAVRCSDLGIDPEGVRRIVTSDPRIGPDHSFMEEPGWQSHCFDKDVPAYVKVTKSYLVQSAMHANHRLLRLREKG